MKVARLIIYEGSEKWLQKQLGESCADGVRRISHNRFGKATISIITIGITPALEVFAGANIKEETK
jgi:hypothetical protein